MSHSLKRINISIIIYYIGERKASDNENRCIDLGENAIQPLYILKEENLCVLILL